jgi:tetratricopeptide (TPR) repeat protein
MTRTRRTIAASLVALAVLASGAAADDFEALKAKAQATWATRDRQPDCQATIASLTQALALRPDWEDGWIWLGWARYWEGNNFPPGDDRRKASYEAGMEAGKKAMALRANSVGGHFWYIVNKSSFGRENGVVRSAVYLPEILRETEFIEKADSKYFAGGVFRLYGRIIYSAPPFLRKAKGYTLQQAVDFCKQSLAVEPKFSLTHVHLSDIYVEMGRYDDARKELQFVANLPENAVPGMDAEVRRDKKLAQKRLAQLDLIVSGKAKPEKAHDL